MYVGIYINEVKIDVNIKGVEKVVRIYSFVFLN